MAEVTYNGTLDIGHITFGLDHDTEVFRFQHGPVLKNGVNRYQNEDVITLLVMRLRDLSEKFPCRENSIAITKLEEALLWLQHRTALRVAQDVEGTNVAHDSEGGA